MVPLNGLANEKRLEADAAYVGCVRAYLGVPSEDVIMISV
jgi:hypothetical protein